MLRQLTRHALPPVTAHAWVPLFTADVVVGGSGKRKVWGPHRGRRSLPERAAGSVPRRIPRPSNARHENVGGILDLPVAGGGTVTALRRIPRVLEARHEGGGGVLNVPILASLVVLDAMSDFRARYHAVGSRLAHPRSAG